MIQWLQDNVVSLFKAYGPWRAVGVIVVLTLLAVFVLTYLNIDLTALWD